MLAHLGETDAAARVTTTVRADLAARGIAKCSTSQIGDAIAAAVALLN
jgi:3-isopropylmalate dehydrogenase